MKKEKRAANAAGKKAGKSGFTIMEMLIVVAIIAVLVAIAIPTFNGSLHKAKVAADEANVRAYYAELQLDYLTTDEYNPAIGNDIWDLKRTITFLDGTQVALQAGQFSAIQPTPQNLAEGKHGYQVYYFCDKGDHTLALGATG